MMYVFLDVPFALIVKKASHRTLVNDPAKADNLILVGWIVLHGFDVPKRSDHVFAYEVPFLCCHTSGNLILSQPVNFFLIACHSKLETS